MSFTINKNSNDSIIRQNTIISLLEKKNLIEEQLFRIKQSLYLKEEELKNKGGLKKFFIKVLLDTDDTIQDFIYGVNQEHAENKYFNSLNNETNQLVSSWDIKEVEDVRSEN